MGNQEDQEELIKLIKEFRILLLSPYEIGHDLRELFLKQISNVLLSDGTIGRIKTNNSVMIRDFLENKFGA